MNPHPHHCLCHLIYPAGAFVLMALLLTINYFTKWIKKKTVADNPFLVVFFIILCIAWPFTLIVAAATLFVWFIIRYCIPK